MAPRRKRPPSLGIELRFCDRCIMRTRHEILKMPVMVTRRSRFLYRCTLCGWEAWRRPYRPSAEIAY